MTSLAELREIEQERIAAERAAIVATAEAARRTAEDRVARQLADETARIAAERAAVLASERAREQAEREARMQVEAVEATERARLQAAIEQERIAQELQLRRDEVAKKRPTWMVAVTLAAMVAVAGLTWFALDRQRASEQAQAEADRARSDKAAAIQDAQRASAQLASVQGDLAVLDTRVGKALHDLEIAGDAEARQRAAAEIKRLRDEQRRLEDRRAAAKRAADLAARRAGLKLTDACKKNAFDKSCP